MRCLGVLVLLGAGRAIAGDPLVFPSVGGGIGASVSRVEGTRFAGQGFLGAQVLFDGDFGMQLRGALVAGGAEARFEPVLGVVIGHPMDLALTAGAGPSIGVSGGTTRLAVRLGLAIFFNLLGLEATVLVAAEPTFRLGLTIDLGLLLAAGGYRNPLGRRTPW